MSKKAKIGLTILIMFILGISFLIYDLTKFKDYKYGISNTELEIGNRYVIGDNGKDKKICDKFIKYGCLEGNIISYKIINSIIYIYYTPYQSYHTISGFSKGDKIYSIFGPYDNFVTNDINKKPNLIKMHTYADGVREFYHSSDIEKLNEEDKKIFNELISK